ncbi:MarR family winged helix-turn-helix transcriptional regulator [Promicromonospora sp. NPDC059942]|uniref:MarR family winged helix-turn-helix transcriptional regulator n=1 Tax=Promicromonospora sp. NPDC059942 TaxID=3347009 RepID=UPI003655292E
MSTKERIEHGIRALITGGVLRNHEVAPRLGLHVIDLQALSLVAMAGGRMTPSALADAMRLPRSSVTRLVGRLESAGYVRRRRSDVDRRSLGVEVDQERLAAVTDQYRQQSERVDRALSGCTPDEVETIARFLDRLTSRGPDSDAHQGDISPR